MTTSQESTSVSITPISGKKTIKVSSRIQILYNPTETGRSCYIPGFEIYFSASDEVVMLKKSQTLTRFYFDHYLKHSTKSGMKSFVLDLHKRGFKANNDISTVHSLINNKMIKAKFNSPLFKIPENFKSAPFTAQESVFGTKAYV